MPELESLILADGTDEEKAALLAAMHKALHFIIIVHHPDDLIPRSTVGLSLKHNSPTETRQILAMHKVPLKQVKLFMRVYEADYAIYRSDIQEPEWAPARIYDLDGSMVDD